MLFTPVRKPAGTVKMQNTERNCKNNEKETAYCRDRCRRYIAYTVNIRRRHVRAQAFSRKLQNITGANESAGAAAVTDPVCASSDDTAPTVRAGIEGDVVYLLICDNGRLFAVDERGNEIFTADIDPDTLGSDERELLSRGLSLSGDAALREAIEDLLH